MNTTDIVKTSPPTGQVEVTATCPSEMEQSQEHLVAWCENKLGVLEAERRDLRDAYDIAKKNKWASATLYRQLNKCIKCITYYEKMKAALAAGFYIIPTFPTQIFAIRTDAKNPQKKTSDHKWASFASQCKQLPIGEGQYRDPEPGTLRRVEWTDKEGKPRHYWEALSWSEEVPFPVVMAKPDIMEFTERAMAMKIFDELGVLPAQRKGDPIIVGNIVMREGYSVKKVSFLLAWHINSKDL